jgi:membrane protein
VVNAWIAGLGAVSVVALPAHKVILHTLNSAIFFLIITGLFAALYKILPDVHLEWRDVVLGGAFTSALFTIGRVVIGLYLGRVSYASTHGASASLIVFIIWVYYSSQIFFLGAEFTKTFANRYGSQPNRHPEAIFIQSTGT